MADASKAKRAVCWVVFGIVICIAVYRLVQVTAGPLAQMPDTPESAQVFICRECGHTFSLTPRERAELMAKGGAVDRGEMTPVRRVRLPCPACNAIEVIVARRCPRCGKPYARTGKDGQVHLLCPDCEASRSRPPADNPINRNR